MRKVFLIFIFTLTLYATALAQSNFTDDTFVITTYYPAPYGVYRNMRLQPSDLPTNGVAPGVMYFNQTQEQLYIYKNDTAKWQSVGGGGEGSVPRGVIVMWSGLIVDIPAGWALCDGTNGTPDLKDKFILGVANATENPGGQNGTNFYSLRLDQMPSHSHTGTTATAGAHTHGVDPLGSPKLCPGQNGPSWNQCVNAPQYQTSSAGDHSHSLTIAATGSGALIDNRPAFYKLAFIMKL